MRRPSVPVETCLVLTTSRPLPLAFQNFALNEPNNGSGSYEEDCAIIAGARPTKQWDDRPCDPAALPTAGLYAYLCQF